MAFGFGGADSHPSRFTLGCKPLQHMLKVLADEAKANRTTSSAKSRDEILWFPNLTLLRPLATPRNPVHKDYEQDRSCSGRTETEQPLLSKGPGPHTRGALPQNTTRDTVECLLQIHKAHVDWLGKLP
ncbi:hypothetical protein L3Q82_020242 [Scortum barcoo]|uniref:Uncharacterized protein n=1 Tax=Scortum barcoo TaxID=214431 RepID=A0ACB8VAC8_9TELE|nr:hypothetical protein L3Q82_020242 [Scortum barcoo]